MVRDGAAGTRAKSATAAALHPAVMATRASQRRLNDHLTMAIAEFKMVLSPLEIHEAKKRMSKMQRIAERIQETRKKLDDEADKLAAKMDDIDKQSPLAMQNAHAFLDQQKKEIDEIDNTLRQLSNLPLAG